MCGYTLHLDGTIRRNYCEQQLVHETPLGCCTIPVHVNFDLTYTDRYVPPSSAVDTPANITLTHFRVHTLHINIDACSTHSLTVLSDIVAHLPHLYDLTISVRCPLRDITVPSFTTPSTFRTISCTALDTDGLHLIRQFSRYATHVAANISIFFIDPTLDWLPSVTFLRIDTTNTLHISNIVPRFPHLVGLFVCNLVNPCALVHLTLCHPNIRYIHHRIRLLPNSHLPNLAKHEIPPFHWCPSAPFLDSKAPSFPHLLGHRLSSFLLAVHRLFPNTDPLVVQSIFTHLTSADGICSLGHRFGNYDFFC